MTMIDASTASARLRSWYENLPLPTEGTAEPHWPAKRDRTSLHESGEVAPSVQLLDMHGTLDGKEIGGFYRTMHIGAKPTVFMHKLLARTLFLLTLRELAHSSEFSHVTSVRHLYMNLALNDIDSYPDTNAIRLYLVTHEEDRLNLETKFGSQDDLLRFYFTAPVSRAHELAGNALLSPTFPALRERPTVYRAVESARKILAAMRRAQPETYAVVSTDAQIKYLALQFRRALTAHGKRRTQELREVERRIAIDTRSKKSRIDARYLPIHERYGHFMIPQGRKAFLMERDMAWKIWIEPLPGDGDSDPQGNPTSRSVPRGNA